MLLRQDVVCPPGGIPESCTATCATLLLPMQERCAGNFPYNWNAKLNCLNQRGRLEYMIGLQTRF